MEPINYNIPAPNIGAQFAEGFQIGGAIRGVQERKQAELAAQQARQQFATDLQAAQQDGSQTAWLNMIAKYPQFREAFGDVRKGYGEERAKNEFIQGSSVSIALENNKPDIAISQLDTIIQAKANKGEDTKIYEQIKSQIENGDLVGAKNTTNFGLSVLDPDKFEKMVVGTGKFKEQPITLREKEAVAKTAEVTAQNAPSLQAAQVTKAQGEASKATTEAKFAEPTILLDLEKKGWDIKKIKSDIDVSKQQTRIAAMNASIAREGNDLKRQELRLKVQEAQNALDDKIRTKVADVQSARGDMDNFLNTADRFLKMSIGPDGKPTATLRAATGPLDNILPTWQPDVADLEELASTLSSQAFMSQIPKMKGTGALSEKEGEKLQASLQNLSLRQSADQLLTNVKEAQRLILKARKNLTLRSGVPESIPDTPNVAPSKKEVDDLVNKYTK